MAGVIEGLSCPSCGGSLQVAEGALIVVCGYCGTSLLAVGDRGLERYRAVAAAGPKQAEETLKRWMGGMDKARDLRAAAELDPPFLVFLPFWKVTGRLLGWILGHKLVRREKRTERKPVEREILKECAWDGPACDVAEFGVSRVGLGAIKLHPYDEEGMQREGMVFEATTARSDAEQAAEAEFIRHARRTANVDEVKFERLHLVDRHTALVHYPLWVIRYRYRGRKYQTVIDAVQDKLVFGRAPGSRTYRALALVGGMGVGNFILTTVPRAGLEERAVLVLLGVALVCMAWGFVTFRYGEEVTTGGAKPQAFGLEMSDLRQLLGR